MITDFLSTTTPKADLAVALNVLREFKGCESQDEWVAIPFVAWTKLEQFEEYLEHMVNGAPLQDDTVEYILSRDSS